ncbi:MAG: Ig-like domain-containing protein, partial [Lachnospiraceae bacterium]|nr:Ig-like domain-containing protein [Lachnospiraceae bacterium]
MGNRVRIADNSIAKRFLALLMALLTMITSWSIDWNTLRVQAADNSSELTQKVYLSSGSDISYTYTNPDSFMVGVDAFYFKICGTADAVYTYDVSMVQSGSTAVFTSTGNTVTGTGEDQLIKVTPLSGSLPAAILDSGDYVDITVTITSDDGNGLDYYVSSSGDPIAVTASEQTNGGRAATVTITGEDVISYNSASYLNLYVGQSSQLDYTIEYNRDVNFTSSNESVATVSSSGLVTAVGTGSAVITAATNNAGDTVGTITVNVIGSSFTAGSYPYTGKEVKPSDIVVSAQSTLVLDSDYYVTYSNNINIGTATATIIGKNAYAGYSETLSFTITPTDIAGLSSYFDQSNAIYTIDTSTSAVTISGVRDTINDKTLVQDTDFTATAGITGTGITGNTRYYYYTVTITGIGNYTGSLTKTNISTTESAGLSIGSFYTYELEYDVLEYDGTTQKPGIYIYDINGNYITYIEGTGDGTTNSVTIGTETLTATYTVTSGTNGLKGPAAVDVEVTSNIYDNGKLSGESYTIVQNLETNGSATLDSGASISSSGGIYSFLYTGAEIIPTVTVKDAAGSTLAQGTGYTLSYNNNVGSDINYTMAQVTITGTGLYTGSKTIDFRIVPNINNGTVILDRSNKYPANSGNGWNSEYSRVYSGEQITPEVALRYNSQNKTSAIESITYGENTNVSSGGYVTIRTKADSIFGVQELTVTFKITPQDISGGTLDPGSDSNGLIYNGSAQELSVYSDGNTGGYKVSTESGTVLVKDTDYTIGYSNNVNVGTAAITATGMGNYTGSVSAGYTIGQLDLSSLPAGAEVALDVSNVSYTGMAVTPEVSVAVTLPGGTVLTLAENTDYITSFSNNISVGSSAVARVTGIQNFTGTISKNFSVVERSIVSSSMTYSFNAGTDIFTGSDSDGDLSFTATNSSRVWNGYAVQPGIAIFDGSTPLVKGTDFTVEFADNTEPGTATATITGKKNYAGAQKVVIKFTINKCAIDSDRITITNNSETDAVLTIRDTVKSGYTLIEGTDYTVTKDTSKGGGVKTATIKGIGSHYTGTATVSYILGKDLSGKNGSGNYIVTASVKDSNTKRTLDGNYGYDSDTKPMAVIFAGNHRPNVLVGANVINDGVDSGTNDDGAFDISYTCLSGDDPEGYDAGSLVKVTITAKDTTDDYYGTREMYYRVVPAAISSVIKEGENGITSYDPTLAASGQDYIIYVDGTDDTCRAAYDTSGKKYTKSYLYSDGNITPSLKVAYFPYDSYKENYTPVALYSDPYMMIEGEDYTITTDLEENSKTFSGEVGTTATFTITGEGNFTGSTTLTFSVTLRNLAEVVAGSTRGQIADIEDQVFEGEAISPEPVVTYDGETLTKGTDYTVSYSGNNNEPGTVTITVTGTGNYGGTITKTFNIVQTELNSENTTVTISPKYPYKGSAYTFNVTDPDSVAGDYIDSLVQVKYGTDVLKYENGDFDIEYSNNIYPGTATLTLKPGPNKKYSVSSTAAPKGTFTIYLNLADTSLYKIIGIENAAASGWGSSNGKYVYSPKAGTWTYYGGSDSLTQTGVQIQLLDSTGSEVTSATWPTLKQGTNFTETWSGMTTPGTGGLIKLTGNGQTEYYCTGSISIGATIYGDLSDATVSISEVQAYTGQEVKPVPVVTFGSTTLSADYYTVGYESAVDGDFTNVNTDSSGTGRNTRTVRINASANGYYSGSNSASYVILYNLNSAAITGVNASYTHSSVKTSTPTPTVTVAGKQLTVDTDYTISRSSTNTSDPTFTAAGSTITIKITAADNYSYGSKTVSYAITGNSLTGGNVTYDAISGYTYTGSAITPVPANVAWNGAALTQGSDYYLTYTANTNAGTAYINLNGMGNYTGSYSIPFIINKKDIASSPDISAVFPSTYYYAGGSAVTPSDVYLLDSTTGKKLTLASDFSVSGTNNTTVTDDA